ncbi:MAG TPA: SIMPL domain-containing protein, partial [Mycobacterium sp.]|nr:SIMPL domain-containing protein [Mycobacterium sp.]
MEPVYGRVARDLDAIKASVAPMDDPHNGPVTWWSADQLRTWSRRPWSKDGKQLPLVHHAAVSLEVQFRDFSA